MMKHYRITLIAVFSIGLYAHALLSSGETLAKDVKRLEIIIGSSRPTVSWHVGDIIVASLQLKNISTQPVAIPNCNPSGSTRRYEKQWFMQMTYTREICDKQSRTWIYDDYYGDGIEAGNDLVEIRPGEITSPVYMSIMPLIPGKGELSATFDSTRSVHFMNTKRVSKLTEWDGRVYGELPFTVSNEISLEMKQRYDKAASDISDKSKTLKERQAFLRAIAEEKHYFAARFVWNVWKTSKEPAIQKAALGHVLDLLEFGTAFENLKEITEMLLDDSVSDQVRKRILDIYAKFDSHGLTVGKQACYDFPKELGKQIIETLQKLEKGPDPYLAIKARNVLGKLNPKPQTQPAEK